MADEKKAKLDAVSNVEIDGKGKFKYVLIEASIGEHKKHIVRGTAEAEWHGKLMMCISDVFQYNFSFISFTSSV